MTKSTRSGSNGDSQFRGIFDYAPIGIFVNSQDGLIIQANSAFCGMVGYSAEELVGRPWASLTYADDLVSARLRKDQLWSGLFDSFESEARFVHRNGRIVSTRIKVSLVRDANRTPAYSIVHVEDLTDRHSTREALRESEMRFQIMADGCPTMLWVTDAAGSPKFINRAYCRFFDVALEEVERGEWQALLHPDDRDAYMQAFHGALRKQAPFAAEARVKRGDGEWRWLESWADPRFSPGGEFLGHVGLSPDITHRKQAEQQQSEIEEKFRQLAENIHEVFWIMDAGGAELQYLSPAYEQIWGRTCATAYEAPESWMDSIHPEDRVGAERIFRRQLRGETVENEYRIVQPSGSIRWIRDRAFPVHDKSGCLVRITGVAEDITHKKLSELRLIHNAEHDDLTGLPNRNLFMRRIAQAVAECPSGQCGAVFFIDLDQLKLINETLGHSVGDAVIRQAADRFLRACPESGMLARFGGDEFLYVAAGFDGRERIGEMAECLLKTLGAAFRIGDREVFLGANIGVTVFPEQGVSADALKRNADLAMREAKRTGKNQIRFFSPAFEEAVKERLDLETRLRRALELGEFMLAYQPQFAVGKPKPIRFEALIRWRQPDGAVIPPCRFIPVAEQNGLIIPIGTWALEEACRACAAWQAGKLRGVGVAVNVSAVQFSDPNFVALVGRTLELAGLGPELLEIELTESVFLKDMQAGATILSELRNLGITIALDDFGTGYSSLSYLESLPLDALKIDRSFLNDIDMRPHAEAVLRCVVDVAHALSLRVIAEGVETQAQLDLFTALGCDEIQGYLLGKPSLDVDCPEYISSLLFAFLA